MEYDWQSMRPDWYIFSKIFAWISIASRVSWKSLFDFDLHSLSVDGFPQLCNKICDLAFLWYWLSSSMFIMFECCFCLMDLRRFAMDILWSFLTLAPFNWHITRNIAIFSITSLVSLCLFNSSSRLDWTKCSLPVFEWRRAVSKHFTRIADAIVAGILSSFAIEHFWLPAAVYSAIAVNKSMWTSIWHLVRIFSNFNVRVRSIVCSVNPIPAEAHLKDCAYDSRDYFVRENGNEWFTRKDIWSHQLVVIFHIFACVQLSQIFRDVMINRLEQSSCYVWITFGDLVPSDRKDPGTVGAS